MSESLEIWLAASTTDNMYMALLDEALSAQPNVQLHSTNTIESVMSDLLLRGPPDVFHIHWVRLFFLTGDSPDFIFGSAGRATLFLSLIKYMKTRGTTIVWTAHNLYNHEKRAFWVDRLCHQGVADLADGIITHSETASQIIANTYGLPKDADIRAIPHGHYRDVHPKASDGNGLEMRRAFGLDEETTLFMFFGRLRRYKNVGMLIDAFRQTQFETDAALVIAGKPRTHDYVVELRERIGEAKNIFLDDRFIPDSEIPGLFAAADAVVLPYETILSSGSAVLAMSMGKPVIGPAMGTMVDILSQQSQLLYDPMDAEKQLSRRLAEAQTSADLEQIGAANEQRALEWDWETVGQKTAEFYRELSKAKALKHV